MGHKTSGGVRYLKIYGRTVMSLSVPEICTLNVDCSLKIFLTKKPCALSRLSLAIGFSPHSGSEYSLKRPGKPVNVIAQ
jgi:hypothetical protein